MQFVCTQGNLLKGLAAVAPLAGRNPQLPVLQQVLVEVRDGALHLTCTDLEVGAHVVVGGKAEAEGSCTVPARQLLEYVQQLPESQTLTLEKKRRLVVGTEGFNAQFAVTESDDFPLLPTPRDASTIELDGRAFCQALSSVSFAAARDEARPELRSLLVAGSGDEVRVAATDSFRLAERVVEQGAASDFSWLLPTLTVQEVVRLFHTIDNLTVLNQKNHVSFQGGGVDLSSRLIDAEYPNYQQIIPTSFNTSGTVKREELARALKVVGVFISRDSRRVRVAVDPSKDVLTLSVEGGETGQGTVDVGFEGEGDAIEALFNINYLLEGVQHIVGDSVQVSLGGASDPIMLKPADEGYLYIVMPIQP